MRALTIWPEWIGAIMVLGKPVENRTWEPPAWLSKPDGPRLALHAGKYVGGRRGAPARAEAVESLLSIPGVTGDHVDRALAYADRWAGHIVGTCWVSRSTRRSLLTPEQARWAAPGACWWILAHVKEAKAPQPVAGAQGLWTVPPEVEAALRGSDAVG